ncbi:MAG TPA: hypothetical protein VIK04_19990 [Solirubrobacteraceae bacterium]
MTDERNPPEAELARLADGSLSEPRQAELRAQVQASPELAAALAEQARAVTLLRALDQPAPAALRSHVDAVTGGGERAARGPRLRRRRALVLPGAPALAVIVAAVVLVVSGGNGAPTVPQAARLTLAAATLPAPRVDAADPTRLQRTAAGIPFPNWAPTTGWRAAGARTDTVSGRRIDTVFYTAGGSRVGYAIAAGSPLPGVRGQTVHRYGVRFTLDRSGSLELITWLRSGHTCVIAGRGVSFDTLLRLAGSDNREAVSSPSALHNTGSRSAYL